ncbi:MAG: c-type cytochrome [Nitrospinae bacterium]|nr:c-type cytochrome [Nitrospinota bacterium]
MKTRHKLIVILLFAFACSLPFHIVLIAGEFYKWTGRDGTVHFTDNYYSIPPQYRKQIEIKSMPDRADKKEGMTALPANFKKPAEEEKSLPGGERIFNEKCLKCHSLKGENQDKSATQLVGLLNRENFKASALPVSEDSVRKIIREGGWDEMPAFPELTDRDMDEFMKYLIPFLKRT